MSREAELRQMAESYLKAEKARRRAVVRGNVAKKMAEDALVDLYQITASATKAEIPFDELLATVVELEKEKSAEARKIIEGAPYYAV